MTSINLSRLHSEQRVDINLCSVAERTKRVPSSGDSLHRSATAGKAICRSARLPVTLEKKIARESLPLFGRSIFTSMKKTRLVRLHRVQHEHEAVECTGLVAPCKSAAYVSLISWILFPQQSHLLSSDSTPNPSERLIKSSRQQMRPSWERTSR